MKGMYAHQMFEDVTVQTTLFLEAPTNPLTEAFLFIYIVGLEILYIVSAVFFC